MMIAGFGIFIPIGLVIFFVSGDKGGLFFALFGLLPTAYLIYRVLSPGAVYSLDPEGVFLRHGRLKRRIPLEEVRGAAVLSEEQTRAILHRYMAPGIEAERAWNVSRSFTANRPYVFFTQYCTVPLVQETASRGHRLNIVKFGVKASGRFVILKLTTGEEYLISPEDCDSFFVKLSSLTALADTTASSSYSARADAVQEGKLKRFFKWYKWLSVPAVLVVILLVSLLNVYLHPEEDPAAAAKETEEVTGWIDDETFRYRVTIRMETHQEDPALRQQEFLESAETANRMSFISQVISWYCQETGLDPDEEQYDSLYMVVELLADRLNPEFDLEPVKKGVIETDFFMNYSGPNLKQSLKTALDETLKLLQ